MSESYVYFIKPVDATGPIKIGVSGRPKYRLSQLLEWSPVALEVVLTIPGNLALERNIHECFADCHSHKEWFYAAPRLVAAIQALAAGVPVHEAIDLNARLGSIQALRLRQFREAIGTSREMEAQ
jgi:hypothetical protein